MSRHVDPPTLSDAEHLRMLVGMLTAGHTFRQTHDPRDMMTVLDDEMNLADYMGLLGLSMGLLFNILESIGMDPGEYIAALSQQLMKDGL